jgi:DNA repair exonuclease SbcCD nuclease subunit
MKLCLLGDTHFGCRNDALSFHDYFEKFYQEVFFPYLDEHKIDTVVQFGDLFDRRKYINFVTLSRSRQYFFDELQKRNIQLHVFVGNHDTFYKNTNIVNSPDLLLKDYDNISIYDEHVERSFDGLDIALLPWVNSSNYQESLDFIENTRAQVLFGHLELAGFEMYRGAFNDHGMSADLFRKFDIVATGHYHHKSSRGNIHYLGTPYEMTWSDFQDTRGFHILDTNTREMEFIQNPHRMFNKIHYMDADKTMDQVLDIDLDQYKNTFVKVIVQNKTNPYWFDLFIDRLEKNGVIDLQVVEDHFNLNLEDDEDIVNEAEDTLTILRKVVEQVDSGSVPKKELDNFLSSLYTEALYVE